MKNVRIQAKTFDSSEEENILRQVCPDDGALVAFKGFVRGLDDDQRFLNTLYLEHYPAVTEQEIARVIDMAQARWPISGCTVIHRVGKLKVGDPIILVLVSSKHRKAAFPAAEFIMDYLKTEAPFWKKEFFTDGTNHWVKARESDVAQKLRWV